LNRFTASAVVHVILAGVCAAFTAVASANEESDAFHRFWPDNLFAVDFVTEQTGFIAGQGGTVLRTTDGGENWDALYIGENELIRRIDFVSENDGWAVGHRGAIFHTSDAGNSWEVQYRVPDTYLRDVAFVDKNHGWAVGHNATILHTSNGGQSWQKQEMRGFKGRDLPRLHGVYAKDRSTAIVVGEFGTVIHTENGGELWLVTPSDIGVTWLAVDGAGGSIYVAGSDGSAAYLTPATDEQRLEMDRAAAEAAEKAEQKARKKAKRRKKKYVPPKVEVLPRADIEYIVNLVDTGTTEHLFDVATLHDDSVIVVGRSVVFRLSQNAVEPMAPAADFPLAYVWFGGAAASPSGAFWGVGIRGLVVRGNTRTSDFAPAFNLGSSDNITLVTNRWASSNGR
jgi:photosystem II stability/assembly factor-like uncharacterized protein